MNHPVDRYPFSDPSTVLHVRQTMIPDDTARRLIEECRRRKAVSDEMFVVLTAIVEFCDDPNGSEKPESLALGLARMLPAARAAIAKAEQEL